MTDSIDNLHDTADPDHICPGCFDRSIVEFFHTAADDMPPNQNLILDRLFVTPEWDSFSYTASGVIDVPEVIRLIETCGLNATVDISSIRDARLAALDSFYERSLPMLHAPFFLLFNAFDRIHVDVASGDIYCDCDD